MRVELIDYRDNWQAVKDAAMNTVGKDSGKYPTSEWKRQILLAEHSPIRLLEFTIRFTDIPYYVVMHLVRHHIGVQHFVKSQREDRSETHTKRHDLPQDALIDYTMVANAQALINISRKRLCNQASPETRKAWQAVIDCLKEYEPELASVCVRECVYRGFCPELRSCGYQECDQFGKLWVRYVINPKER